MVVKSNSIVVSYFASLEIKTTKKVHEIVEFSKWISIVIVLAALNQNQDSFSARFFSIFASSSGEN